MPKVSIIMPTYQRAALLGQTLGDLVSQTLKDFELILMDDGSTDHTSEVVASVADKRIRYVRNEHLGIPRILNAARGLCSGEYIIICHDHDRYDPSLLEELAALLDAHPTAAYSHCGVIVMDAGGTKETLRFVRSYPELISGGRFLTECLLPCIESPITAITMIRQSCLGSSFFDPAFGGCADVELWLRLSTIGDVAYVQRPLIRVRERTSESSYFYRAHELAELVLDAKRRYLYEVEDPRRRRQIEASWRRDADGTSLATLWKAMEDGRSDSIVAIRHFARREGTRAGAAAVALLSEIPRPASIRALRGMRWVNRAFRKLLQPSIYVGSA